MRERGEEERKGTPKFRRVVLKLSGEALAGEKGFGIDPEVLTAVAEEIRGARELGVEIAVVVGGELLAGA